MSDEAAEAAQAPDPAPEPEPEFPAAPPPDPTGDPRVDAAVAPLGGLGALPVAEHVRVFEDVHRRLQDLLASADQDEPAPAAPPRPAFPDALRPRP
ncbi:hypothetical protein SAMN05443665_105810 [Actinomadura meyerae]|jgi:hypothetical protein|uniref:Uncharacterized protein n=1 Tax=Actinomadura meyerae TaxID=240840 RepID=A0A239P0G3_9ACTN|nr:hypothetical protein [Actinomadura meyerae]SNT60576.1 hypothetical protein SAMN05443665_105810 [Actinomadura meyerae]